MSLDMGKCGASFPSFRQWSSKKYKEFKFLLLLGMIFSSWKNSFSNFFTILENKSSSTGPNKWKNKSKSSDKSNAINHTSIPRFLNQNNPR